MQSYIRFFMVVVVPALLLLLLPAASAQVQFSEGWTHGKRDVSSQLRAAGGQQPSLLDVLTSGALQQDATCRPETEALGLIYDLVMRTAEKEIVCRTSHGFMKTGSLQL